MTPTRCALLQAVVTAVERVRNVDRAEAERIFAAGVQYTQEETETREHDFDERLKHFRSDIRGRRGGRGGRGYRRR